MRVIYYSELDGNFEVEGETIVFVGKFRDMRNAPILGPLDLVTKKAVDDGLKERLDNFEPSGDVGVPYFDGGDLRNSAKGANDFELYEKPLDALPASERKGFQPRFDSKGRVTGFNKKFVPIRGKLGTQPDNAILTKFSWTNLTDNPGTMASFVQDATGYIERKKDVTLPKGHGRLLINDDTINRKSLHLDLLKEMDRSPYFKAGGLLDIQEGKFPLRKHGMNYPGQYSDPTTRTKALEALNPNLRKITFKKVKDFITTDALCFDTRDLEEGILTLLVLENDVNIKGKPIRFRVDKVTGRADESSFEELRMSYQDMNMVNGAVSRDAIVRMHGDWLVVQNEVTTYENFLQVDKITGGTVTVKKPSSNAIGCRWILDPSEKLELIEEGPVNTYRLKGYAYDTPFYYGGGVTIRSSGMLSELEVESLELDADSILRKHNIVPEAGGYVYNPIRLGVGYVGHVVLRLGEGGDGGINILGGGARHGSAMAQLYIPEVSTLDKRTTGKIRYRALFDYDENKQIPVPFGTKKAIDIDQHVKGLVGMYSLVIENNSLSDMEEASPVSVAWYFNGVETRKVAGENTKVLYRREIEVTGVESMTGQIDSVLVGNHLYIATSHGIFMGELTSDGKEFKL